MSTVTTADAVRCLDDFREHLLRDALTKQRPTEAFAKMWLSAHFDDPDCSKEDLAQAMGFMVGEVLR